MDVYTSLDGKNWSDAKSFTWERSADMKEIPLKTTARYIKLFLENSVGNFFAASEIKVYKVENTNGFAIGSIAQQGKRYTR